MAPNTALGRAQFRMGIAQIVGLVLLATGVILISTSGEQTDKQGNPDPDNAKIAAPAPAAPAPVAPAAPAHVAPAAPIPGAAKAGNWLMGIGGAALGVTTFMSMLTGITIGAQGNYGR